MVRPRIGIDARLYGAKHRGLGRYTAELVHALESLQDQFEFVLFVEGGNTFQTNLKEQGFAVEELSHRVYSIGEQFKLPRVLNHHNLDLVHFPHLNVPLGYRRPFVMTIHDLILHHFPNRTASTLPAPFFWIKYVGYRFVTRSALARARQVITVSAFTAEDTVNYFPGTQEKLTIIKEPVPALAEIELRHDINHKLSYNNSGDYVLVVGAFYPHKNIARLLRAWSTINTTVNLVLVGPNDSFAQRLRYQAASLGLLDRPAGRVIFAGAVEDSDLKILYQRALFLLVPSLFEGVGLPGLEALSLGTPVVSSPTSGLPEAYGATAVYIPVEDDGELHRGLQEILAKKSLVLTAKQPLDHPSYEEVGEQLRQVYTSALRA